MPIYPFECEDCNVEWDVMVPISKRPKRKKCPECGKYCKVLMFREGEPPNIQFKGTGWWITKHRKEEYDRKGMDKETADRWLNDEIKNSKERMKSGNQHYKRYIPNYDVLVKQGVAKRVSDKRAVEKKEIMKKQTEQAHKNAKLDPTTPVTPQPI